MSLCFGTSFGEFLFIEPRSISMIKCLALNQLKMIPKNVKNHSYCASGITSPSVLPRPGDDEELGRRPPAKACSQKPW